MKKGTVKRKDIRLTRQGQPYNFNSPLFFDKSGEPVYVGDMVKFYFNGGIFPCTGFVSNFKELRIDTFNTFLNKWEFYLIDLNDELKE